VKHTRIHTLRGKMKSAFMLLRMVHIFTIGLLIL